jgi:hypothetical protein
MFFDEAVWASRPVGPTAKRQPSPARAGASIPQHLSERRRRGTLSPRPASVLCRKTFPGRACRTADPSATLGMTKGRVALSLSVRWLAERTAGPHSTSLRAGSPLRYASVGMTIHIWVGDTRAQEKLSSPKKSQTLLMNKK